MYNALIASKFGIIKDGLFAYDPEYIYIILEPSDNKATELPVIVSSYNRSGFCSITLQMCPTPGV